MTEHQIPTPRQVAENEAARQAVILAFGVAAAVFIVLIQRKLTAGMTDGRVNDPVAEAQAMINRENRWSAVAVRCWGWGLLPAARYAARRAEKARAEYEAARP